MAHYVCDIRSFLFLRNNSVSSTVLSCQVGNKKALADKFYLLTVFAEEQVASHNNHTKTSVKALNRNDIVELGTKFIT